jgi:hypothetical protein
LQSADLISPATGIVNERRKFTFMEIINRTLRSGAATAGQRMTPGSLGRNDVAVRASRHQAILHLAGRGQFTGEPQPHSQQNHCDRQPGDRPTPVSALVGVGHRQVSLWNQDARTWRRSRLLQLIRNKNNRPIALPGPILMASRRAWMYTAPGHAGAVILRRQVGPEPIAPQRTRKRQGPINEWIQGT